MKRLLSQSALWTLAAAMLCLPLTASATPLDSTAQSSSIASKGQCSVRGQGKYKRRHKRRNQQVCQNSGPNSQAPGSNSGPNGSHGNGGWFNRQGGNGQQMSPADREARRQRRRERQGMNGSGQGPNGVGQPSQGGPQGNGDREARRERRRERQAMDNRSGQGPNGVGQPQQGGPQGQGDREARRERRRQREAGNGGPGQVQDSGNNNPSAPVGEPRRNPDKNDD